MAGKPAMTVLHLGPGLGNAIANLHNARRARTPILNIVGEMSVDHIAHDAPLTSDIQSLAAPVSAWLRTPQSAGALASDTAEAIAASMGPPSRSGRISTLIVPTDVGADEASGPAAPIAPQAPATVSGDTVSACAEALRSGKKTGILLASEACGEAGLRAAARVAAATGAMIFTETFIARLERGAGLPMPRRLPYFPEDVLGTLAGFDMLVLAGASAPVSFFKYPDYPSVLLPEGCETQALATVGEDVVGALEALADELGAEPGAGMVAPLNVPGKPAAGKLDAAGIGAALGALLPEGAIIAEEALTNAAQPFFITQMCPRHTWLMLTGGAIGYGLPTAVGAAIACPDRKVIALQADGSGMYTVQALWTMAREALDITVVIFHNAKYQILQVELARVGVTERGPAAEALTDLSHPDLDWTHLARGMGVPAERATTAEGFTAALEKGLAADGPHLIEAMI